MLVLLGCRRSLGARITFFAELKIDCGRINELELQGSERVRVTVRVVTE